MLELFNRAPWQRASVVALSGSHLGQADCEPTPEGGLRCADGTYHPPGCIEGSPQVIQGQPLVQDFPVVPVAIATAGALAAGAIFLSGKRIGAGEDYPTEFFSRLQPIATSIHAARAADAWNYQQYSAKKKEALDLLEEERQAELALAEENRRWEETHRNVDTLQAAQDRLNAVVAKRTDIKAEADDFQARVQENAQNILAYRQQAMDIISMMPESYQAEARKLIDPCYQASAMKGISYPVVNR